MDMMMAGEWTPMGAAGYDSHDYSRGSCAMLRAYLTANYDRLLRRLTQYLGCPDQAGDSLHDAWVHLGEMSLPSSVRYPEAYIYRVARNLAIDRLRGDRGWLPLDDLPEQTMPADPCPGPEDVAEARSELLALDRVVRLLPRRNQAVLFELRVQECSRADVALRFGLSLRRVDSILRQSLDYCLAQRGEGEGLSRREHVAARVDAAGTRGLPAA